MRPLLLPALRRLWRDASTLQLGLDPGRAIVVGGLPAGAARLLDRLDGTADLADVLFATTADGLDHDAAQQLVGVLVAARAVVDAATLTPLPHTLDARTRHRLAPDVASLSLLGGDPGGVFSRRRAGMVEVHGPGRMAVPLAATLAAAGVGRVHVAGRGTVADCDAAPGGLTPADVGRPWSEAAAAALRRVAPQVDTRPLSPRGGARRRLAVLTGAAAADANLVERLVGVRVPHLVVTVRETTGVVGPLVLPGQSSCLDCANLHRRDRDPAWPALVAQLSTAPRDRLEAQDTALTATVTGLAALQALAHLEGAVAQAVDGTLELALPDCRIRRRSWVIHPRCGCRSPTWARTG